MSDEWITVARFRLPADAEPARAALEGAGIEARLLDGSGALVHVTYATSGLRLQVRPADREEAEAVLASVGQIDEAALEAEALGATPLPEAPRPVKPMGRLWAKVAAAGFLLYLLLSALRSCG